MPIVKPPQLTTFSAQLFKAVGVPEEDAAVVAESLVAANLRGHDSHGVMRIPQYLGFLERGEYRIGVPLQVESETPSAVVCDAQWGLGQVQARRLLEMLLPKARRSGVAAGTARQCGHIGRLGEYAELAASEGLILMAAVTNGGSAQRVAPPGGIDPRLATNPLCVAVPTTATEEPVVLDFGTSVAAEGTGRVNYIAGTPVPEGWLLDGDGEPTCDPRVLYEPPLGSIRPMGGKQAYKGFGLGMVVDLLVGGLSGGRCSHADAPPARGNDVFFLALDPDSFAGSSHQRQEAGRLTQYVRSSRPKPGQGPILLPGDPERLALRSRSTAGIKVEGNLWRILLDLAQRLGAVPPEPVPSDGR